MTVDMSKSLEIASCTHAGMVRSHNEDSIGMDARHGLLVLADGMGGYNAGEVASGMATALIVADLKRALEDSDPGKLHRQSGHSYAHVLLRDQVEKTNTSIYQTSQSQPQYSGMGTTLVLTVFYDNRMTVAHIGDSRLYRLRGEEFAQVTRDHSLLQEQLDSGIITAEQARHSQNKNLVTRALGIDPVVDPEIHEYETQAGDIYLLCSDGLSDMVEDEEISMTLQALEANLNLAAQQLVQLANDNGGRDNVSVILVRVARNASVKRGWLSKLFVWLK